MAHTLESGVESGPIFAFPPLPLTLSSAQLPKRKVGFPATASSQGRADEPESRPGRPNVPVTQYAAASVRESDMAAQTDEKTRGSQRGVWRRKTAECRFKRRRPRRDVGEDSTGACVFTCDQVDSCQWQFGGLSRGEAGCSLGWTAKRAVSLSAPAPGDRPDTHSKRR
ncbi:hypothetical protein IscW_ISCW017152 [Ixodes scapularis]|uniref:Uncharacterized protein n=1 Tax=Ixodes scapularis TaxID=6945 RepID=B7PAA8_IXOSC|nr:hypothetical protein IscW_ISCW017152 [Ixodes scapularis]|eukprot:XP_002406677.1 hypothetical protein IscW_ISCW017152 [Ixodes scapularis]